MRLAATMPPSSYDETLERLFALQKFGIKLGLNSTQNLLGRLGDPHLKVPCLHIAGTSGTGSVGAICEATLREARLRVGFYTSPHLIRFTERFRLNGREISPRRVVDLARQVEKVMDPGEPPTFFEVVTAMAFLYFAEEVVDLLVLETGMGGRLDATNVCRPLVTVITNIGLEHQQYLGSTLAAIAGEKAGIIKPGVPLVHGVAQPAARRVVEARAAELGAPVIRKGRELSLRRHPDGSFDLGGRLWHFQRLATNLAGHHQPGNACLALGALEEACKAGVRVAPQDFAKGLGQVDWPGRLERIPTGPGEPALWLDGAHNLHGIRVLLDNLDLLRREGGPLVMVLGIMADKDYPAMLAALVPAADRVVFSAPDYARAARPEVLAQAAPAGTPHEVVAGLDAAIRRAQELAGPGGTVLVAGSLFTVGEARGRLVPPGGATE